MAKQRILFVDDEPRILSGIRRSLRSQRDQWEMVFADSGPAALESMAQQPADIVVSDMRMSPMDGATLLTEIMNRWPQTVRIILSGQSKKEGVLRSFGCAHQYLPKPCTTDRLVSAISRAQRVRRLIHENQMSFMIKLAVLPSPSRTFEELSEELLKDDPSITKLSETISKDVALSTKTLQLVNSPYFGFSREIGDIHSAITMIGFEGVRPIAFLGHFIATLQTRNNADRFPFEDLYEHSISVARYTEQITAKETSDKKLVKQSFSCGLLHDCGALVLAANLGSEYDDVLEEAERRGTPLHEMEAERLGITHSEVGAYLLDLWGLPDPLIESAAFHHDLDTYESDEISPALVVHAADIIDAIIGGKHPGWLEASHLQEKNLSKVAPEGTFERWLELCKHMRINPSRTRADGE